MGYAELVRKVASLPRDKQIEVFDFVEFLAERDAAGKDDGSDLELSAFSLAMAMRGLEDEPPLYTLADVKERWS